MQFPSYPQQVGQVYFKTTRKCGIFGIHNERRHVQVNYLIDEADTVSKGANCVISLLHDYLTNVQSDIIILVTDNCQGQNKNNTVLQYLLWGY